jgi:hypothetical protein
MKLERQMNLLKKTLLATAVAAISTGAMAAKTNVASVSEVSAEGYAVSQVANDGSVYNIAGAITIDSGVNWSKDDTVTVTISGAEFAPGLAYTLTAPTPDPAAEATFTLMSASATEVVFRVAQVQTSGQTVATGYAFLGTGTAPTLNNAIILPAGAGLDHEVEINTVVRTSAGQVIDATDSDTVVVAKLAQQYEFDTVTLKKGEAKFAASTDGLKFTEFTNAADAVAGVLAVPAKIKDNGGSQQGPFVVDKQVVTVTGAVSPFDTNANQYNGTLLAAGTTADITDGQFTFTSNAFLADVPFQITDAETVNGPQTATAQGDSMLVGNFDAAVTMTNLAGKSVSVPGKQRLGSIGLDSVSTTIPYLPIGDAVSPFVWVTNNGTATGDIHVSAMTTNGAEYDLGVVAKSTPGLKKIDKVIVEKLKDAGVDTSQQTVRVELYVEGVTATDAISVYAAYKHIGDSDRLQVPVTQDSTLNLVK